MLKSNRIHKIFTPITASEIRNLRPGDPLEINGKIFCGRDAVLPKIVTLIETGELDKLGVDFQGSVIFHTAVSPAGIGPTTSNKVEIESSIPMLSKIGVRIHLGKGSVGPDTVKALKRYHSVFAITPPVSALFSDKIVSQRIAAFPEEGMEALYEIAVKDFPAIIASAHGETIFPKGICFKNPFAFWA
jgi:fumarate hydratase subunit beta